MHSAYFLRLGDDGTGSSACTVNTKSKACRKHVVTVTSTVAQKLYITGHTWDERMYPKSCRNQTIQHRIEVQNFYDIPWSYGTAEFEAYDVFAGESFDVTMEMDWSNKNAGKDFSLTVYGDKGAVSLKHKGGLTTQHMPVAPAKK